MLRLDFRVKAASYGWGEALRWDSRGYSKRLRQALCQWKALTNIGTWVCVCVFWGIRGGNESEAASPEGELSVWRTWHLGCAAVWPQVISPFLNENTETHAPKRWRGVCSCMFTIYLRAVPLVGGEKWKFEMWFSRPVSLQAISCFRELTKLFVIHKTLFFSFQVSSDSLHREPLHHPAAEEDRAVPAGNLRRQTGHRGRAVRRCQNVTQSSQPAGKDTHQSKNNSAD